MSCNTEKQSIDINDLEEMLQEAKKGRAKVDKHYVDYDTKGQLFDYKINFSTFLEDIDHIFKAQKARDEANESEQEEK